MVDVADLEPVFDFPMVTVEDQREAYGELRLQSLGILQGRGAVCGPSRRRHRLE